MVSTLVVVGTIVLVATQSPGWDAFDEYFLNWGYYRDSFGEIARAFLVNVRIFVTVEAIVLVTALLLAILRSLPGPVFFPVRALAVVYVDFFRGVPTILVILMLGQGIPALQLSWLPTDQIFWASVALVLVYTAYVSEVYRAGIESVHPSQERRPRGRSD